MAEPRIPTQEIPKEIRDRYTVNSETQSTEYQSRKSVRRSTIDGRKRIVRRMNEIYVCMCIYGYMRRLECNGY